MNEKILGVAVEPSTETTKSPLFLVPGEQERERVNTIANQIGQKSHRIIVYQQKCLGTIQHTTAAIFGFPSVGSLEYRGETLFS